MAGSPDLFVVCKNCNSEVSPYITECPYCGQRLRKRAPKIERGADGEGRAKAPRRAKPSLAPLRSGEIPGIAADPTRRPVVAIALVVLGAFGYLLLAVMDRADVGLVGAIDGEWWRVATSPFLYDNGWYQLAALLTVGIYAWLLEKRHGHAVVLLLVALCGFGPIAAVAAIETAPLALGGNGLALGLLAAWAVPVLLARRSGYADEDHDLLGTLVLAVLVAAMPIAVPEANPLVGTMGLLAGGLVGLVLSRTSRSR